MNWFQNVLEVAKQNPRVQLGVFIVIFVGNSMIKDSNYEKQSANLIKSWERLYNAERKDKVYFREKYIKRIEKDNEISQKEKNKQDSIKNILSKGVEKKINNEP